MSDNWKQMYQYSENKGFPTTTYQKSVSKGNVPKKLFEECIPRCFPVGAQAYDSKMMKCASNCKSKTVESYNAFKEIFRERLGEDGFVTDPNG